MTDLLYQVLSRIYVASLCRVVYSTVSGFVVVVYLRFLLFTPPLVHVVRKGGYTSIDSRLVQRAVADAEQVRVFLILEKPVVSLLVSYRHGVMCVVRLGVRTTVVIGRTCSVRSSRPS